MRKMFALASIVATLIGCVGTLEESPGADDVARDVTTPQWYPKGPYGTAVGDTVENAVFQGKSDTNADGSLTDESLRTIQLSDFARHGTSKTEVLLLTTCAQWCVPCNQEQGNLVALWQSYQASHPDQVKFVSVMADDIRFNAPTELTLNQWGNHSWYASSTGTYVKIPYDLVIDPHAQTFVKYEDEPAYPFHLVVRAKGMTIAAKIAGANLDEVQAAIDAVLAEPNSSQQ